jgi:hypothetical protein
LLQCRWRLLLFWLSVALKQQPRVREMGAEQMFLDVLQCVANLLAADSSILARLIWRKEREIVSAVFRSVLPPVQFWHITWTARRSEFPTVLLICLLNSSFPLLAQLTYWFQRGKNVRHGGLFSCCPSLSRRRYSVTGWDRFAINLSKTKRKS